MMNAFPVQKYAVFFLLFFLFLTIGIGQLAGQTCCSGEAGASGFEDLEFSDFESDEFTEIDESEADGKTGGHRGLPYGIGALAATVLAGILVHFKRMRFLRNFFLLGSLVILGFMNGGCPCSISSFQNVWLWILGQDIAPHSLIWFLGLIPITYFFGKVWCGWVCHLGAFQEFLYRSPKTAFLHSDRFQKALRLIRIFFFVALILQLFITKTNMFIHYDPFKAAFNLFAYHSVTWILLILLLLSSLFVYRPFCNAVCPVGLVLGWISRIPGAFKLKAGENCNSCTACVRNCKSHAIDANVGFHQDACIMCGECFDRCQKEAVCCDSVIQKKPFSKS